MKHFIILTALTFLLISNAIAQTNYEEELGLKNKVVLMQPTDKTFNELPEMEVINDTSLLYKTVMNNINNSFINEFIDIYFIAQIYLKNTNKIGEIEPAYLALTKKEGGFAKYGFALKKDGNNIIKKDAAYIDITAARATSRIDQLMSFSQLYPHEMGHVLIHLLCAEDTLEYNTLNVNIHYFSIITDYATAFNEGFAEHIENVSRLNEKNDSIKAGTTADLEKIEKRSTSSINGFRKDFLYPFRLGYYKASMITWYQKLEDYKRYTQALNGEIAYKNESIKLSSNENCISYRNSGVRKNKTEKRNLVQLHATEGVISAFFTQLSASNLPKKYLSPSFYKLFQADTSVVLQSPEKLFNPLQNQFIKYQYVLNKFVVANNSSRSQLSDFIEGYMQAFPSEAAEIKNIYKKAIGIDYTNELPPPLWLLVKDYQHRLLALDPFGAITAPLYTFDLNAAEVEDLLTINGLARTDAEKIINYRNKNGLFTAFEQLEDIPGLSAEALNKIGSAYFNKEQFEKVFENFELKLNFTDIITKPLLYLFSRASIYFLILFAGAYFLSIKREKPGIKATIGLIIKYFLLWVLFSILGLASVVVLEKPWYSILILFVLSSLLALLIFRKKRAKKIRTVVMILAMSLLILASIL